MARPAWGTQTLTALSGGRGDATLVVASVADMDDTEFSTVSVRTPAPGAPATQVAAMQPSVAVVPVGGYTHPECTSVYQRAPTIDAPEESLTLITIGSWARLPASAGP